MSAPPGYNASATMLPDGGGAIRAMQGGFSASPYTGGVTPQNSLLPDVRAPIASYSGGGNNEIPVAVASTVASTAAPSASAAPIAASMVEPIAVALAAQSGAPHAASHEAPHEAPHAASNAASHAAPIAVATLAAQSPVEADGAAVNSTVSSAVEPIAVSVAAADAAALKSAAAASPLSSSSVHSPIDILTSNPTAKAAIAAVSALAISNFKNSSTIDDAEKKLIKIYGKEYNLPDPAKHGDSETWGEVMAEIGLDVLPDQDQKEFKIMIYEDSTCIEKDLPISTAIQCKPMRNFIFKLAEELLKRPLSVHSGIELTFRKNANIEHLSKKGINSAANKNTPEEETSKVDDSKQDDPNTSLQPALLQSATSQSAPLQPATSQSATSQSASSTSTPTPVHPQASSVENHKGGLRKRARRTIRKK